jgi:hypothetical protein
MNGTINDGGGAFPNYDKLQLGRDFSSHDGDNNNHGDCFNYGSVAGCDENCPALLEGQCEIYANAEEYAAAMLKVREENRG